MAKTRGRLVVDAPADYARFLSVTFREFRRQQIEQLRGPDASRKLHEVGYGIDRGVQLLVQRIAHERLTREFLRRCDVCGEVPTLRRALHSRESRELSSTRTRSQPAGQALGAAKEQIEKANDEIRLRHRSTAANLLPPGACAKRSTGRRALAHQIR
jgi:hypothetical protein